MPRIVLVTGGIRSGKSAYAQRLAESLPGPRVYIATACADDAEMEARVARHRAAREGRGWRTIEAPLDVAGALATVESGVALVDCVTVWLSNLCYAAERAGAPLTEEQVREHSLALIGSAKTTTVFVTQEIGLGGVPMNAVARRFTDLLGLANQTLAGASDEMTVLVGGVPMQWKGTR